jgi:hypothetical protein
MWRLLPFEEVLFPELKENRWTSISWNMNKYGPVPLCEKIIKQSIKKLESPGAKVIVEFIT